MSFSGSDGNLVVDSCLSEIPNHGLGGVDEMLSDKKIPSNVRTFSMLTEELLRKRICDVETWSWIACTLSNRSGTAKLWVDCFVHPSSHHDVLHSG